MHELTAPDQALASRVLESVGHEHRLVAYRYRPRAGGIRTHLYSFEEVALLLNDKYPRLNLEKLQEWLQEVIQDEELADRVAEVVESSASDRDRMLSVRSLMEERLNQCKKAASV